MDQIIKALAEKLNLSESVVRSGLGVLLNFVRQKAPGAQFDQLLNFLPGATSVMAGAPSGGGSDKGDVLGGLLEKAGGLFGGEVAETAGVVGTLQQAGVPLDKIGPLARGFFKEAEGAAGPDVITGILEGSPALQALKDLLKR